MKERVAAARIGRHPPWLENAIEFRPRVAKHPPLPPRWSFVRSLYVYYYNWRAGGRRDESRVLCTYFEWQSKLLGTLCTSGWSSIWLHRLIRQPSFYYICQSIIPWVLAHLYPGPLVLPCFPRCCTASCQFHWPFLLFLMDRLAVMDVEWQSFWRI